MATIRLPFGKKKRYGIAEKQRTKEEVDREYSHHAMMYGHAARIMSEQQEVLDHHLAALRRLAQEGSKLPQEKSKAEEPGPQEPQPA